MCKISRHKASSNRSADIARYFSAHAQRPHADAAIERGCQIEIPHGGRRAAQNFHQRQQINRIERMPDQHALCMAAVGLKSRRKQAGGTRGDHHVRPRRRVHARQQPAFQILDFRSALLNEIRIADCILQFANEAQPRNVGAFRQSLRVSAGHAFATLARKLRSAPAAGSHARTSCPCARQRAAQPAPMTPVPTIADFHRTARALPWTRWGRRPQTPILFSISVSSLA